MRYSVLGFNQEKAVELGLDVKDLLLLSYIEEAIASPKMKHIVKDDIAYVWLQHDKIREDLPILDIKERSLIGYLKNLESLGLIMSETVHDSKGRGSNSYYAITERCEELKYDHTQKIACENERPHAKNCTSDNKLSFIDSKLDNTNTNVLVADAPRRNIPRDNSSAKKEPAKKKSRYEKCLDIIDELVDDTAIELKEKLKEYLQMRLNMRDKQMYVNQWKSLIEKLLDMSDSNAERIKIVKQSLECGWASFYELKTQSTYRKGNFTTVNGVRQNQDVFSEYGKVKSVREQEDNLADEQF